MSPLTPQQRSQRARLGGFGTAASHDSKEYTKPARDAFARRFLDEVDPERLLPEAERNRRAEAAKRKYFLALAFKSARARSRRAGGR
jgi:hypothetical protein